MNSLNLLPKKAMEAQRKHPVAFASLLLARLLPMVVGLTGAGLLFKRLFPSPGAVVIFAGAVVFILLIPVTMCCGVACWLALARRIVPRSVAQALCVHPGFGILSRVSERMFAAAYGEHGEHNE